MQIFLMNSRLKEMGYMMVLSLLLLMVIPLLMSVWIYEGPKRLILKYYNKIKPIYSF